MPTCPMCGSYEPEHITTERTVELKPLISYVAVHRCGWCRTRFGVEQRTFIDERLELVDSIRTLDNLRSI